MAHRRRVPYTKVYNADEVDVAADFAVFNGKNTVVRGRGNILNGDGSTAIGPENTLNGDDCIAVGDHVVVYGNRCKVTGRKCKIYGKDANIVSLRDDDDDDQSAKSKKRKASIPVSKVPIAKRTVRRVARNGITQTNTGEQAGTVNIFRRYDDDGTLTVETIHDAEGLPQGTTVNFL